jgi:Ca2+-binding RTX toxin-like protein
MAAALVVQAFVGTPSAFALGPTPDRTWNTNGTVRATALSEDGSTLYIGGKFTSVRENPPGVAGASVNASNVAAIDVTTGAPIPTWTPQVTDAEGAAAVHSLAVKDGRVFIGGNFTAVGGQPRHNLAAVAAADGSVDPFAPRVLHTTATPSGQNSHVMALLASDSKLYVGGWFNTADGKSRANLAAFDLESGALDPVWRPRANDKVRDLESASDGLSIFAAGTFRYMTGSNGTKEERQSVARLWADSGNLHPWKIPTGTIQSPQNGWDLTVTPTVLYGGFGLKPNYAAAFQLATGDVGTQLWRFNTVGNVQTVALSPDGLRLFFGGHFGTNVLEHEVCGGQQLSGLASVNALTGQINCDWIPQLEPSVNNANGPWAMTSTDTHLWVGGGFTHVSGVDQRNLARFDYNATLERNYAAPQVDLDGLRSGGLDATYFDNANFTGTQLSRTDATVNFDWGSGSPDPSIGPDSFSTRWTGQIEAPASGEYTFTTTSDDGVRLFVDGRLVIENWTDHAPTDNTGTITLEAGRRYDIQLDFYENGGGAVAKLQWSYPGQQRQIIPSASLFFPGGSDYSATFTSGTGPTLIVDPDKLSVMDADDTDMKSAKVTLTNRPDGTAERLSAEAADMAIAINYDAQTGVLSLQGPATKEAFRQVLGTVRYDNTSASPTGGERRVTFVVNDGSVDSKAATSTVLTTALPCTIVGTSSAETLNGTPSDDVICAGAGNDTIKALEGNDTLKGEGGADRLYGGIGDDHLDGGTGTDNANFSESPAAVSASLETNSATGEGSDTFSSIENLTGSNGSDTLRGSEANNNLNGLGGADGIVGLGGADTLLGSAGDDTLDSRDGVEGNDSVDGGGNTDTCTTDATENSILNCEQ